MKFCLRARQNASYLKMADEIRVECRDHATVPDLAEKYPNATIILELRRDAEEGPTHQDLIDYNILCKEKFICCVEDLTPETNFFFTENKIKYYWGYAVATPHELNSIKMYYNVCYVRITAPLFFQMDLVSKYEIPVRLEPNQANFSYLVHSDDGINGTWVRPEDLAMYEPTVAAVDFFGVNYEQEQALYRIYAQDKKWSGDLSYIISGIVPTGCANRMLDSDFTKARLNCGQRCEAFGSCRRCYHDIELSSPELLQHYLDTKSDT